MKGQFLQFFQTSINNPESRMLIEKCGSDSVLMLDGRYSLATCIEKGIEHCRKNNIEGFRVCKTVGDNGLSWYNYLTDLYRVSPETVES